MNEQKETPGALTAGQAAASPAGQSIDIEKLAEKVYQLMRAEARLARSRGDTRGAKR